MFRTRKKLEWKRLREDEAIVGGRVFQNRGAKGNSYHRINRGEDTRVLPGKTWELCQERKGLGSRIFLGSQQEKVIISLTFLIPKGNFAEGKRAEVKVEQRWVGSRLASFKRLWNASGSALSPLNEALNMRPGNRRN